MALAACIVPRVLQPCLPEVEDEDESNVSVFSKGVIPYIQEHAAIYHYTPGVFSLEDLKRVGNDLHSYGIDRHKKSRS